MVFKLAGKMPHGSHRFYHQPLNAGNFVFYPIGFPLGDPLQRQ
jgi:hypothetical protein